MTCQEALRKLFADPQTSLTRDAVYEALDKAYPSKPWKRNTIYLHLIAFSINHPQRKHHRQTEGKCFLLWDGHKGFRKWIPEQDGTWTLGAEGIVRIGEDGTPAQVKAGKAADSVCGQILGYIAWVRKELAGATKVRGIIVASDFSDRLRYAADAVGSLSLIQYNITFNFSALT
jgi:hypothetical protein